MPFRVSRDLVFIAMKETRRVSKNVEVFRDRWYAGALLIFSIRLSYCDFDQVNENENENVVRSEILRTVMIKCDFIDDTLLWQSRLVLSIMFESTGRGESSRALLPLLPLTCLTLSSCMFRIRQSVRLSRFENDPWRRVWAHVLSPLHPVKPLVWVEAAIPQRQSSRVYIRSRSWPNLRWRFWIMWRFI